jgi:hypothetical protein
MAVTTLEPSVPTDRSERLRRSLSSWERLHAVIIGFALTSAVKIFADARAANGAIPLLGLSHFYLLIAFTITLVPFFHGAQRHLEATHLSRPGEPKSAVLFFDYMMLILEAFLFSLLGMAVGGDRVFAHILIWLMSVDLFWAGVTYFANERSPALVPWIVLDIASLVCIGLLWRRVPVEYWAVALGYGAVVRTIADYSWNWKFFLDLAPAPAPVTAPKARPKRIAIESPLSGDRDANTTFAENVCKWVTMQADSPYAMHLLFTRFLDDTIQAERDQGISAGLAWVELADEVWFCLNSEKTPLNLSPGMTLALEFIEKLPSPPVRRYRTFTQDGKPVAEYSSPEFTSVGNGTSSPG